MIQSFKHKGLKLLFEKNDPKKLSARDIERLENILAFLNRAARPENMGLNSFRLHPLKGNRKGFWSVTVRSNWRVVFRFKDGDAYDVDLIDYH
ncbi:MAG: type II toxin-antitoxin system RelE/ParE family toxin [Candidatus Anammoxibacter sp.]